MQKCQAQNKNWIKISKKCLEKQGWKKIDGVKDAPVT